ncbi:MAG: glucose-6-phosphate dehydrogenase assembly protein OpcA [Chloroflexota bacterium]
MADTINAPGAPGAPGKPGADTNSNGLGSPGNPVPDDMASAIDVKPYTVADHDNTTVDSGAAIPVAVDYVEAQLVELWRDVAMAAQAMGGSQSVTTAQVLNLVVRAKSYKAANSHVEAIELITGRHPSRVIVAATDQEDAEMPVQAWVSIHCQLPPSGGRQVCCELVTVAAGSESERRMAAAIIPLLLPDLPVFCWWPEGDPFDEYVFRNLSDSLNRLIVDSAHFESPEGTLSKMSTQLKTQWPKLAVTDINWGRLTPWREMVAGFFDAPNMRPYLDRIGHVNIEYALTPEHHGHVNRAQALLLAGWLASRLGWETADNIYQLIHSETSPVPRAHLTLRSGKRNITVDLNAVSRKTDTPGDIYSIRLEVPGAQPGSIPAANFSVSLTDREDACAVMRVESEGSSATERTIQLQPLTESDLLDEELEVYSHDVVYEDALSVVGAFIRGTKHTSKSTPMSHKVSSGEPISAAQAQQPRGRPQGPISRGPGG